MSDAKWWKSPVERLVTSGATGLGSGTLGFAQDFEVPVLGWFDPRHLSAAEANYWTSALGLKPLPDVEYATPLEQNLALADAIVALGEAPRIVRKSGKHLLAIHRRDKQWPVVLNRFIAEVQPAALLLVEGEPPSGNSCEREQFAQSMLSVVFAVGEERDPNAGGMDALQVEARVRALRQRYPEQFKNTWEMSIEPGWLAILESLCGDVDKALTEPVLRAVFSWSQIKEKFGGLRAYYDASPIIDLIGEGIVVTFTLPAEGDHLWPNQRLVQLVQPLVEAALLDSTRTCAICGATGSQRLREWRRTLCDLHAMPGWREGTVEGAS